MNTSKKKGIKFFGCSKFKETRDVIFYGGLKVTVKG
ncbi:hypothetical protein Golax_010161 [Gossypium laxum]|uniref:Uncharacterized protein n=1 Tax=Gossypium laxum TaxID=34288 RepID=A0A7J8ZGC6_9ROSI|nr:hypothetical protein [Gossypium laxum]